MRQRVGPCAVGKGGKDDEDACDDEPPAAPGHERESCGAGDAQGDVGGAQHCAGCDVALGDAAAGAVAPGAVEAAGEVVVFVGEVAGYLRQDGENQADTRRRGVKAAVVESVAAGGHHSCGRHGQRAQPHGFNPAFQRSGRDHAAKLQKIVYR